MPPFGQTVAVGIGLVLVQALAALPWLAVVVAAVGRGKEPGAGRWANRILIGIGVVVAGGVVLAAVMQFVLQNVDPLQTWGGVYGAVLQVQLAVDFFVVVFAFLLAAWPKGGAVALASFREGLRHPMFWFVVVMALILLAIMPFIPYFTFGEDVKMVKDLGYSTIMICTVAFGVLAAAMLISEEIEGRTAITLMSKPVSRRQFLIGRFLGLLLAAGAMTAILMVVFQGVLAFKLAYEKETPPLPAFIESIGRQLTLQMGMTGSSFIVGALAWLLHAFMTLPGIVLGFCQAMVLLAIAVALATRLPMIVNVVSCAVVFLLGNLTPALVSSSQQTANKLVRFIAQLFDTILPSLEFFNLGPAIARDTPLPPREFAAYLGTVLLYATMYTLIALFVGLILFEDRDLA